MTSEEELAIRNALGEAAREPLPDSVSILEAVQVLADLRDAAERHWSRCHARHMQAERILREVDLLTYNPLQVNRQPRQVLDSDGNVRWE